MPTRRDQKEAREVEERSAPRTPVIYEVVRRFGEEEMARPAVSLWWSGASSSSPRTPSRWCFRSWRSRSAKTSCASPRVWSIVLAANLAGALVAAMFCSFTPALSPEVRDTMLAIGRQALDKGWVDMLFRAITAGFLMAAMVWLLPSADAAQFHVITLITYVIAISGSVHIVTGSVQAFLLMANGQLAVWPMAAGFLVPVLLGNIVGGTALFAMISYAQVMKEI